MLLHSIDQHKKDNLNKIYNLVQKEKETNWLKNLFKKSTTRDIYNEKDDIKKITLMFNYIKEYLYSDFAPLDIKESYIPYLNTVNLTYDIKYNDMYLEISVMPSASIHSKIRYINGYLVSKVTKNDVGVPFIDLNEVIKYLQIKNSDIQTKIMAMVKYLKENGVDVKEILNNLQIAYATVANDEIRKR